MTTETFNYDRICKVVWAGEDIDGKVFVEIRYDNLLNPTRPPCLSLTGVIGPKRNGDSKGSCGQILPDVGESCTWRPTGDLNKGQLDQLLFAWRRWHLNTMRAGCEHQRAEGWEQRPIDPTKPLNTYGRHVPGSTATTWNMLTWVSPSEHPDGLLGVPCPTCGYKFGTAWQHEEVPYEVLDFLRSLPECSITYPWMIHIDDIRTSDGPRNGERVQILSENGTARADVVLTEHDDIDEVTADITLSTGVLNRTHHWQLIAVSTTSGSITLRLVART